VTEVYAARPGEDGPKAKDLLAAALGD